MVHLEERTSRPERRTGDGDDTSLPRRSDRLRAFALKRPHVAALVIALTGVVLTLIAWMSVSTIWRSNVRMAPIADVRLAGTSLEALDAGGRVLWSYPFAEPQEPLPNGHPTRSRRLVIADITGDDLPEVIYTAQNSQSGMRLFVFNSDGTLRFDRQWTGTVRFGTQDYYGPFQAMWVWVTRTSAGRPDVWLASRHRVEFPTVLERLDPAGAVTATYWTAGEVTAVTVGRLGARDVILVGSVANEGHGAALAVFEAGRFGGTAPGPDAKHTCGGCPPERPLRFFILPRDELARAVHGESDVAGIVIQSGGAVTVVVNHLTVPRSPTGNPAQAITDYTFDADFNLERADYVYQYRVLHDVLFKNGLVDHDFAGHKNQLFPILEWQAGKFVEVWPKNRDRGSGTGSQLERRSPNPMP